MIEGFRTEENIEAYCSYKNAKACYEDRILHFP